VQIGEFARSEQFKVEINRQQRLRHELLISIGPSGESPVFGCAFTIFAYEGLYLYCGDIRFLATSRTG
jgi:hypothetical protein